MKRIGRRLLALVCTVALTTNGGIGVIAQDKQHKQDKKNNEKAGNVLSGVALTDTIFITATDPIGGPPRTLEGVNGSFVKGAWQGGDIAFQFFSQEMSFDNRLIAGAPFSADVVSETIQTLADGTHIVQRSEGRIYRDSQGRTRNERALQIGDMSEPKQTITIHDPVDGVSYILDPETKSALKSRKVEALPPPAAFVYPSAGANPETPKKVNVLNHVKPGIALKKVQPPYPSIAKAARASGIVQVQILISETGEVIEADAVSGHPLLKDVVVQAARQWVFKPTTQTGRPVKIRGVLNFNFMLVNEELSPAQVASRSTKYTVHTEQLPKQMVEDVECEGERRVMTLPVGAIGNDRPIETLNETWYSPELKMMVLSKRSDPRFGESTYRVINITRSEPEEALFHVPPDYTIRESGK